MLVVEAGVLEQLILAKNPAARAAFLRDPDWAAPPLWRSDFRRVLWSRIAEGELKMAAAIRAFEHACQVIADNEIEPDPEVVLDITFAKGLDLYDAEYAAVAKTLGIKLMKFEDNHFVLNNI